MAWTKEYGEKTHDIIRSFVNTNGFQADSLEEWNKFTLSLLRNEIQDKSTFEMLCQFTHFHPSEVFGWYKDNLPVTQYSAAWHAANKALGSLWMAVESMAITPTVQEETIFPDNLSVWPFPPTPWSEVYREELSKTPFLDWSDDLQTKLHDTMIMFASDNNFVKSNYDLCKAPIMDLLEDKIKALVFKMCMFELSHMHPSKILGWKNNNLTLNLFSFMWKLSKKLLGSVWAPRSPQAKKPKNYSSLDCQMASTKKKLNFALPLCSNFLTLVRTAPSNRKVKKQLSISRTYLKLSLPILIEDRTQYGETQMAFIRAVGEVRKVLLAIDQGTAIYPFEGQVTPRLPILKSMSIPISKSKIEPYIHKLRMQWAPQHKYTTVKFLLGHKKQLPDLMASKKLMDHLDMCGGYLVKDPIQSSSQECIGVLLGIVPMGANLLPDLASALLKHPRAQNKVSQLDFTIEPFRTTRCMERHDPRVGVVHVHVASEEKLRAFPALRLIYPSRPKPHGNYPLGIQYRFARESASLVSDKDYALANTLCLKTKIFLTNCTTMKYPWIKSLHCQHPHQENTTLLKILVAMRSKENKPLFHAIEQDFDGDPMYFHFNYLMEQEACQVIQALPLFLEKMFGKEIALKWVDQYAWEEMSGYSAHHINPSNKAKSIKLVPNKVEDWEGLDEDWDIATESSQDISAEEGNIIIQNFDLLTLEKSLSHVLGDDTRSAISHYALSPGIKDMSVAKYTSPMTSVEDTSSLT